MVRRGLVVKEGCPTDRRGAYVVVTDEGRRIIARAAPAHVAAVRRLVIDRVEPADLAAVGRVAQRVLEGLAAERDATRPGPEGPGLVVRRGDGDQLLR